MLLALFAGTDQGTIGDYVGHHALPLHCVEALQGSFWSPAPPAGTDQGAMFKGDDGVIALEDLPVRTHAYQLKGLATGGHAARKSIVAFARAWFASSEETTSNLEVQPENAVVIQAVYDELRALGPEDLRRTHSRAKQNSPAARTAFQHAVATG